MLALRTALLVQRQGALVDPVEAPGWRGLDPAGDGRGTVFLDVCHTGVGGECLRGRFGKLDGESLQSCLIYVLEPASFQDRSFRADRQGIMALPEHDDMVPGMRPGGPFG